MSTQMESFYIPPYTSSKPHSTSNDSRSKSSPSNSDLLEKCRKLAANLGHQALQDHSFEQIPDVLSPINTSPTRRASSQLPNLSIYSNTTTNNHNRNHSPNGNSTGTGSDCGNGLEGIDEDPNEGKYSDEEEEELLFGTVPSQLSETASSSFSNFLPSSSKSLFSPNYSLGLTSTSGGMLNSPIVLDESDEEVEQDSITPTRLGLPLSKG